MLTNINVKVSNKNSFTCRVLINVTYEEMVILNVEPSKFHHVVETYKVINKPIGFKMYLDLIGIEWKPLKHEVDYVF